MEYVVIVVASLGITLYVFSLLNLYSGRGLFP